MKSMLLAAALLAALAVRALAATNLVANGSFETACDSASVAPAQWETSGDRAIRQSLATEAGPEGGGRCLRLTCTEFVGDGPSAHAMVCQVGRVAVTEGRVYRLAFRARGRDIPSGYVEVALSDMNGWHASGLSRVFSAGPAWEPHEFVFRATRTVLAASSRLQFWFKGTGSLWLDDVELAETSVAEAWFPQIAPGPSANLVPNGSFECGPAGWGSFAPGLGGWQGNLYRLEGAVEATPGSPHGNRCLKIEVSARTIPVRWFDYYEPTREPVRALLAANRGWFRVRRGQPLTLSVSLRADADDVPARLAAVEPSGRVVDHRVSAGTAWARSSFTFTPAGEFVFVAAGPDLTGSKLSAATVWVDAVQLEAGTQATPFAPRAPVEAFAGTEAEDNTFTNPAAGLAISVQAYNDGAAAAVSDGRLRVTDFFDREVHDSQPRIVLPPHAGGRLDLPAIAAGTRGWFRAEWTAGAETQTLRCAVLDPLHASARDTPFGFNHAFPWDFLVRLSRQAGAVWNRDWTSKWQTLEPERGRLDLAPADAQIGRVLDAGGEVDVLIPFPSAEWNSTAKAADVAREARGDGYLRRRMTVACAPERAEDFGAFAAHVATHFAARKPRAATTVQILNESVYTTYALPARFGYGVEDYIRFLSAAHGAIRAAAPGVRIVGGPGAHPDSALTRDFVSKDGLRFADALDIHIYDPPVRAEHYEAIFGRIEELMRTHGGPKPVWLTEWGCYADDDPPTSSLTAGDESMNRALWPGERAAAEHIVRFAATGFAHGLRKIFFHAGTCGVINGPDASGVLFEYGGAPRRMLPAVSVFTRIVGVPDACERIVRDGGLRAYAFRTGDRHTMIAWSSDAPFTLHTGDRCEAFDLMGNRLSAGAIRLEDSPVYLVGRDASDLPVPRRAATDAAGFGTEPAAR